MSTTAWDVLRFAWYLYRARYLRRHWPLGRIIANTMIELGPSDLSDIGNRRFAERIGAMNRLHVRRAREG